jgi:FixJ family two-component response regulator
MTEEQHIPPHISALLTDRELEVLKKIVGPSCYTNKEIAFVMVPKISIKTVEIHRHRIMVKLRAKNIVHLCRMVLCNG